MTEAVRYELTRAQNGQFAPLLVALFLILLTFFLMLNSIASRDAVRSKSVLQSVAQTFGSQKGDASKLEVSATDVSDPDFYTELGRSVNQLVQLKEVEVKQDGNELWMTMPDYVLFLDKEDAAIDPAADDFLASLAGTISQWLGRLHIDLDVLVGYTPTMQDGATQIPERELKQAGALMRDLAQRKVPVTAISAGVQQNRPHTVTMLFTIRQRVKAQPNE